MIVISSYTVKYLFVAKTSSEAYSVQKKIIPSCSNHELKQQICGKTNRLSYWRQPKDMTKPISLHLLSWIKENGAIMKGLLVKDGARSMEHGARTTRKSKSFEILHEKKYIQILQTFYTFYHY
jgi:hypothetical protein